MTYLAKTVAKWTLAAVSAVALLAVGVPASAASSTSASTPTVANRIADYVRQRFATASQLDQRVRMLALANTTLQQWNVRDAREGGVRVVNVGTAGCLQIASWGSVEALVQQAPCRDATYEVWRVVTQPDQSVAFIHVDSGLCLAVESSSTGTSPLLRGERCSYGTNQRFWIV